MIIFTNSKNEIKDVDTTKDASLTPHEIDDVDNPFKGWSTAKICCYKATVLFGRVTMMTPYVDSRLIEHIDELGKSTEKNASGVSENEGGVLDIAELADENNASILELADYISSLEEKITALEEKLASNQK